MPRLLQRLLERISTPNFWRLDQGPHSVSQSRRRRRPKSLFKPLPPEPSWTPSGRTQSIVLDDLNPLIHRKSYVLHKTLPPVLRVHPPRSAETKEHDHARAMTEQERAWWSSPYLRMLSSPLRLCSMTSRYLPYDLMVRVAYFQVPSPRIARGSLASILPDGLEHPSFRRRRSGEGRYILCWKQAVEMLVERGTYRKHAQEAPIHSLLAVQIGHLLRLRVLQELEILTESLQRNKRGAEDSPVLRRLTRAEFRAMTSTGVAPYPDAIAILVVPPLNKNPVTKKRPEPASTFDSSPAKEDEVKPFLRPPPPLSRLLRASEGDEEEQSLGSFPCVLSQAKIPLYNGLTLFPSRSQRAALHALLCKALNIERQARYSRPRKSAHEQNRETEDKRARGDQKASHAFMLFSNSRTVLRGDMVGIAIALLRIRMWEGAGWDEGTNQEGGWLWRAYKRKDVRL